MADDKQEKPLEQWIAVEDRYPDDSEMVLITDGVNISTAHWFDQRLSPRTNEVLGGAWVNQHFSLTGRVSKPTHWMRPANLLLPRATLAPAEQAERVTELTAALEAFMEPMRHYTKHTTWLKGDEDLLIEAYRNARKLLEPLGAKG